MRRIPPFLCWLRPVDALVILFALVLSCVDILVRQRLDSWYGLIAINLVACAAVIWVARIAGKGEPKFWRWVHNWYPVPIILLVFKEVYVIIQSLGWEDWDSVLIGIDRTVLGVHPTVWLSQFSFPLLTEILQIAYVSYYFIMLTVGVEIYLRKDWQNFSYVLFIIVYGFFLSYLGYIAIPAVGPRFTLHDFNMLNHDLPGLLFTNALRDFINTGESIPKNVADAIVIVHAQRDAFPSGHTQMTLISLYLASLYKLRSRRILYVLGTLLIISTVYLRYHYVVDVVGGAIFMLFTVWTAPKLFSWWERLCGNEPAQMPG